MSLSPEVIEPWDLQHSATWHISLLGFRDLRCLHHRLWVRTNCKPGSRQPGKRRRHPKHRPCLHVSTLVSLLLHHIGHPTQKQATALPVSMPSSNGCFKTTSCSPTLPMLLIADNIPGQQVADLPWWLEKAPSRQSLFQTVRDHSIPGNEHGTNPCLEPFESTPADASGSSSRKKPVKFLNAQHTENATESLFSSSSSSSHGNAQQGPPDAFNTGVSMPKQPRNKTRFSWLNLVRKRHVSPV